MTTEAGSTYTDVGATATDNVDGDLTGSIIASGIVDTNTVGAYTIAYDVQDVAGNQADTVTRTVNIVDTTKPGITLSGDNSQAVELGSSYVEQGATATDNSGDLTDSIIIGSSLVNTSEVGSYIVTYNVTDSSGNAADEVTRTVNVVDTAKPAIVLNGDAIATVEAGSTYTDEGAFAMDNYDGDLTDKIITVSTVDTSKVGTYTVKYNVQDVVGNQADEVTRTVNVVDTTNPTGSIMINGGSNYTKSPMVSLAIAATDNTSITEMRISNTTSSFETEDGWEDYATSKQWMLNQGNGEKTVYAQFKDGAGNVSEIVSDTIGLDQAAPITSKTLSKLANTLDWHKTSVTVSLSVADTGGSGLDKIFYRIDSNATKSSSTSPIKIGLASDGVHKIYYYSTDKAGNKEPLHSTIVRIDKTKPTIPSSYVYPSSPKKGTNATLYYKVLDAISPKVNVTLQIRTIDGLIKSSANIGAVAKATLLSKGLKMPGTAGTYIFRVIAMDYYVSNQRIRDVSFTVK
jgi:hypothetical protein